MQKFLRWITVSRLFKQKTEDTGEDFKMSDFLPKASSVTCKQYIRVEKTLLQFSKEVKFFRVKYPILWAQRIWTTRRLKLPGDISHSGCVARPHKPRQANGDLPDHAFHKAGAQYVSALRALFLQGHSLDQFSFVSTSFDRFRNFEITLSKSS